MPLSDYARVAADVRLVRECLLPRQGVRGKELHCVYLWFGGPMSYNTNPSYHHDPPVFHSKHRGAPAGTEIRAARASVFGGEDNTLKNGSAVSPQTEGMRLHLRTHKCYYLCSKVTATAPHSFTVNSLRLSLGQLDDFIASWHDL